MQKIFLTISFLSILAFGQNVLAQKKCVAKYYYYVRDTTNEFIFTNQTNFNTKSSYKWDFGDGKTSTSYNDRHTYTTKSTFKACLFYDSIGQCKDTICQMIVANKTNPCNIKYEMLPMNTNALQILFTAWNSKSDSKLFQWQLPSKINSNQLKYTFPSAGFYKIQAQVNDPSNHCVDTIRETVYVKACDANFFYNVYSPTRTVGFTNYSSTSMISLNWDFGDGKTGTGANPGHVYAKFGKYKVRLIAANTAKCIDTMIKEVAVDCESDFYAPASDSTISYNISKPYATSIKWTFGDGGTASDTMGKHAYARAGTYDVCLKVNYSNNDSCTTCKKVKAYGNSFCKSAFTLQATGKSTVQFYDQSKVSPDRWWWNFGDGKGYSSSKNPSYTYSKPGKYWVTLMVWDSNKDCSDSSGGHSITVGCDGSFTATEDSKYSTKHFFKSPYQNNGILQHKWFVNNKMVSSNDTLSYIFPTKGTYQICHVYRDTVANCTDTVCKTISVSSCYSNFSFGLVDSTLNYYTSNPGKLKIRWSFGNGVTSAKDSGKYTFPMQGSYDVCLTVYCPNGDSSKSCTTIVTYKQCYGGFGISIIKNTNMVDYHFTKQSKILKVKWDFGDGTTSTTDTAGGIHKYSKHGLYNICLTVHCSSIDSVSKCLLVNIKHCDAQFSAVPDATDKFKIKFTHTSTTSSTMKYKWYFGDGTTSTSVNPTNKYSAYKNYNVCLVIKDTATGCSDSACKSVTAGTSICDSTFNYSVKGDSLYFNYTGTGTKTQWDFGNGKTGSGFTQGSFVYTTPGKYDVCLTIFCPTSSKTSKKCYSITIKSAPCDAEFTSKADSFVNMKYLFRSVNNNYLKHDWFIPGKGKRSSYFDTITHNFSSPGNYTVCHIVTDTISKCRDTVCKTITVKSKCEALYTVALDTTQKFKLFLINKSSNTSSTKYSWDFGDGNSSNLRNPTHKYNKFGKYIVCLTVNDTAIKCYHQFCDTLGLDSSGKLLKVEDWELVVLDVNMIGINKVIKSDFKIYPNPANTKVTVDISNSNEQYNKIEIINSNGQVCIIQPLEKGNEIIEVNLERLNRGLYLIKLSNDQGYSYTKMMKN